VATRAEIGQLGRIKGREVLARFRVKTVSEIDVEAFAADYDLYVRDGGLEGAEGRMTRGRIGGRIRIRRDIEDERRRRFIIAHELGHYLLHRDRPALCAAQDLVRYEPGNAETEANAFAAEVLMPGALIEPHCHPRRPTLDVVKALAERFNTTFTATAIRFVDLTEEACAVAWSENGRIKWSIPGRNFYPAVTFGRALSGLSHAGDAFRGKQLPKDPELVPGHAWVDGGGDLWEHSTYFRSLGAVLTLLWRES
jgi:hypothetical protein